jgi:hypothetical protein
MSERWKQVESLYHAALERETATRAAFLAEACAGDEELRRGSRRSSTTMPSPPVSSNRPRSRSRPVNGPMSRLLFYPNIRQRRRHR